MKFKTAAEQEIYDTVRALYQKYKNHSLCFDFNMAALALLALDFDSDGAVRTADHIGFQMRVYETEKQTTDHVA